MTDQQKDMLRILEETVEYYGAAPDERRAFTEHGCKYHTEDGRQCAVGRLLTKEEHEHLEILGLNHDTNAYTLCTSYKSNFPSLIHKAGFYSSLQALHDHESNWESTGLSVLGQGGYNDIKLNIEKGLYND